MTTKFSIITITRNNLGGLKQTAQSVTTQVNKNYEWIVIDGVSSDGSVEFLKTTLAQWISEPDAGIYDAMNKGIERASGEYLIFMNAGDQFYSAHTLRTIQNIIKQHRPDFIYGDAREDVGGQPHYKKSRDHSKINQGMVTHHQAMIYSRATLGDLRYDVPYKIAADYDLTWKFLKRCGVIHYMPEPLCRFAAGGVSQQNVRQGRIEQYQSRRANNVPFFKNTSVFIAQTLIYNLRRFCPRLYWFLKRR